MAIKVLFPAGASDVTVRGLYQWDYGQTLEIECAEIGNEMVEVHFACANMTEAVIRACSFSLGVGTVEIPDECLEQASAVTAWICKSDATQRHTIKAITIHLTARTRPATAKDIPEKYVDSYGQLIEKVNEAVDKLENGEVMAARAGSAVSATTASIALSCTFKLVATAEVGSDGQGEAPTLVENAVYIVVFHGLEQDYIADLCGVFVNTGTYMVTALGHETLTIYPETNAMNVSNVTGGTLEFYKIGGLS